MVKNSKVPTFSIMISYFDALRISNTEVKYLYFSYRSTCVYLVLGFLGCLWTTQPTFPTIAQAPKGLSG